jgi:hypothetical protein
MGSDPIHDYKQSRDNLQSGGGKEVQRGQITDRNANGAGMTYRLEVERKGSRVRSQTQMQPEQGQRTFWRWRGSATGSDHRRECKRSRDDIHAGGEGEAQRGQITDANANGAGMTYKLEVERERKGVRSQMRMQTELG